MSAAGRSRGRPRNPLAQARREDALLAVAAGQFAEHGFRQTDVQWIADAAGVGKGTVYRLFPSKEALFLAAVDRGMRRLTTAVDEAIEPVSDPLQSITVALRAYLRFFDDHPDVLELLIQERAEFKDRSKPTYFVHRDANIDVWRGLLRELMSAGRIRRMNVDTILDVISYALYGAIFTGRFSGRHRSFESRAEDVLEVVLHGILTEPEA